MSSNVEVSNGGYRPSASVIIASKLPESLPSPDSDDYNYKVLIFKRTPRTAFATNHCVFPGGMLDPADESVEWLNYFRSFGVSDDRLLELMIERENPPPILCPQGNGCYDRFFKKTKIWARDITLRITAIRETFEEVGVLLCRSKDTMNSKSKSAFVLEDFDRDYWQNLVHNNAKEFLNLCKHLQVIPDLWCLCEWSIWRAPATASRRYETVFYLAALEELPALLIESSEVEEEIWGSPLSILEQYRNEQIWLPFIQYYEVARLFGVFFWEELVDFAFERQTKGSTVLMPVYYRCKDGMIGLLPGDDKYPPDPTGDRFNKSVSLDCTLSEFRKEATKVHRLVYTHFHSLYIDMNIPPLDYHLRPINFEKIDSKM